jgi:ELWxxDGT repeat protein
VTDHSLMRDHAVGLMLLLSLGCGPRAADPEPARSTAALNIDTVSLPPQVAELFHFPRRPPVAVGAQAFFVEQLQNTGEELWVSDGTEQGTRLVRDIRPGPADSHIDQLQAGDDGRVYFLADDGSWGLELWRSDGTEAGTVRLTDCGAGADDGFRHGYAGTFVLLRDKAIIGANCGGIGHEPFALDLLTLQTTVLADIKTTSPGASSYPDAFTRFGELALFVAENNAHERTLYDTDGTPAGTGLVGTIPNETDGLLDGTISMSGLYFFAATNVGDAGPAAGLEIYVTDGGFRPVLLKDINPGSAGSDPHTLVTVGGQLFFFANDGTLGPQLWTSDGTPSGTHLVRQIDGGEPDPFPSPARDPSHGDWPVGAAGRFFFFVDGALWSSDGTAPGTLKTSIAGSTQHLVAIGNDVFAEKASSPTTGFTIVRIDPSLTTTAVAEPFSSFEFSVALGERLLVDAQGSGAYDMWSWDTSSDAGFAPVKDLDVSGPGSLPGGLRQWGSSLVAGCYDGRHSYLAIVDPAGASVIQADPWEIAPLGSDLLVATYEGLMRFDGLDAGLTPLLVPAAGFTPQGDSYLRRVGDRVFFGATDALSGEEPWVYTQDAGARRIADLQPGVASSFPRWIVDDGTDAWFIGRASSYPQAFWSDGQQVVLPTPSPFESPARLFSGVGRVLIRNDDHSLQVTSRTFAGSPPAFLPVVTPTAISEDAISALPPTTFLDTPAYGLLSGAQPFGVWFNGDLPVNAEPYVLMPDGGLFELAELFPDGGASAPRDFTAAAPPVVYFSAVTPDAGRELFRTQGSAADTVLVRDLWPGTEGGYVGPALALSPSGALVFAATDGVHGVELWRTDGTFANTRLVADFWAGPGSSSPTDFTQVDGTLYFVASDPDAGRQIRRARVDLLSDFTPPTILCPGPIDREVPAGGAVVDLPAATVSDDVSMPAAVAVESSVAPGTPFPTGVTQVTCTATDEAGNTASCMFSVTLHPDTVPPVVTCPADVTRTDGSAVTWSGGTASDDLGTVTVKDEPPSGSAFSRGTTPVTRTATDGSGNTASCTFQVTVTGSGAGGGSAANEDGGPGGGISGPPASCGCGSTSGLTLLGAVWALARRRRRPPSRASRVCGSRLRRTSTIGAMLRGASVVLLSLLCAFGCACSGPGPATDGGAGGGLANGGGLAMGGGLATGGGAAGGGALEDAGYLSREDFCAQVAGHSCDCGLSTGVLLPSDDARCRADGLARCLAAGASELDAGQIGFDGFEAAACARHKLRPDDCTIDCSYDYQIYPVIGATGTPCSWDGECGPGYQCPTTATPACVACVPTRKEFEPCDDVMTCALSDNVVLQCSLSFDGGQRICLADDAALGELCWAQRQCAQGLECVDHHCRGRPALGESCILFDYFRCAEGGCQRGSDGGYACAPPVALGAPCEESAACTTQRCIDPVDGGPSRCGSATDPCQPDTDFVEYDSCRDGFCGVPAGQTTPVCFPPGSYPDGTRCDYAFQCASGSCVEGAPDRCGRSFEGSSCDTAGCAAPFECFFMGSGKYECHLPISDGGACLETGSVQGTCSDDSYPGVCCFEGRCQPIPPHALAHGAHCVASIQCPLGDFCSSGICAALPDAGAPCDTECPPGYWCSSLSGTCVALGYNGEPCDGFAGSGPLSTGCHLYSVCVSHPDAGSACLPLREPGGACGPNRTVAICDGWCDGQLCQPRLDAGSPCDDPDQCDCRLADGGYGPFGTPGTCAAQGHCP